MATRELAASELYRRSNLDGYPFETTEELDPLEEVIGQPRAIEAVQFGVEVPQPGHHIFAIGPEGTGKQEMILELLRRRAANQQPPDDWCYVNNFDQPHRPLAIRFPAGTGRRFRDDVERTVDEMQAALAAAFESEEFRRGRQLLEEEFSKQQKQALSHLQERARERGLAMVETPVGFALTPADAQGNPMTPDEVQKLSEEDRARLASNGAEVEKEAKEVMQNAPRVHREIHERQRNLERTTAAKAIEHLFAELRDRYDEPQYDQSKIVQYLNAAEEDAVENYKDILNGQGKRKPKDGGSEENGSPSLRRLPVPLVADWVLRRYRVNLLIEHDPSQGAPVVYEDHPSFVNVTGRVDYMIHMGALVTDFNLIKAGALHNANGGCLVLDAAKLLMQPLVWEALKRSIRARRVSVETPEEELGLFRTVSLEPEFIPLNIKIVLLGSPLLYQLLLNLDPDFAELFKVLADFATDIERTPENEHTYARLIATAARKEDLLPLDKAAVARVIECSSRLIGDGRRLSLHIESMRDLLRQAHHWARQAGRTMVREPDVQRAIDAREHRSDRLRERVYEEIQRGTILIETDGRRVGQVNGLSVFSFGEFLFGRPSKITARARLGKGELIDIEREVALGAAIHSKGVLILSGFLAGRYARELPLSLSASLVFEQSYGGVDGDSASLAELYALLSSIAAVPIRQSIAVTGSVDQQGEVQPVGAVNEKIEGFFDVCRGRGLTGVQGVILPKANVPHLMLRQDVREAVAQREFHIYPVATADEAAEILTGMPAGEQGEAGCYAADTLNGKVSAALENFARQLRRFAVPPKTQDGDGFLPDDRLLRIGPR
jgi:lon-related putative ATP-dependent protease